MAEIYFYQLDSKPLASILPDLLKRSLARGARVAVQSQNAESLPQLSAMLWGHEDVSFLAHGHSDDLADAQPIWLCADEANPNAATYRFFVDGAMPETIDGLARAIILFESSSEEALANARNEWKKRKAEGHAISYWKQDENGKWQNLA